MREVFFLIGRGGALLFADTSHEVGKIQDSRTRWQAILEHQHELEELSHSHPQGPLAFSAEDESTMAALEAALGKRLRFSVVAPEGMLAREGAREERVTAEPWWAALLRLASGMEAKTTHEEE